ncbi:MAG: hypothetical protein EXR79_08750 [Myxococcales bacterium]|nr:hypothetical protein [Myxococcales bacterium]
MPDELVARIKAAADVRRLYAELFPGKVLRGGKAARCFREDAHAHKDRTPSVQLRQDGWHCHGCGDHGDALALVEAARATDFKGALQWLADWTGVSLERPMSGRPGTQTPGLRVVRTSRGLKRQQSGRPGVQASERSAAQASGAPGAVTVETPSDVQPPGLPDFQTSVLFAELWSLLEPLPLSPVAETWLQGRGIDPTVAHALGCRDFQSALAAPAARARRWPDRSAPNSSACMAPTKPGGASCGTPFLKMTTPTTTTDAANCGRCSTACLPTVPRRARITAPEP